MFFRRKEKKPQSDPNAERTAEQLRTSRKLDDADRRVAKLREGAQFLGESLNQGQIGAASRTATHAGFSFDVSYHLDAAEKHYRQDYRAGERYKSKIESRQLAREEIGNAEAYARRDLREAIDAAKNLRLKLRDI